MNAKDLTTAELLGRLASGWPAEHAEFATEFIARWRGRLGAHASVENVSENALRFKADLGHIRLHGMDDVPGLVVGGQGLAVDAAVKEFVRWASAPGRTPFVLAVSQAAWEQAQAILPQERCLGLGPGDVAALLATDRPLV